MDRKSPLNFLHCKTGKLGLLKQVNHSDVLLIFLLISPLISFITEAYVWKMSLLPAAHEKNHFPLKTL